MKLFKRFVIVLAAAVAVAGLVSCDNGPKGGTIMVTNNLSVAGTSVPTSVDISITNNVWGVPNPLGIVTKAIPPGGVGVWTFNEDGDYTISYGVVFKKVVSLSGDDTVAVFLSEFVFIGQ